MSDIPFPDDSYATPPGRAAFFSSRFPSFFFTWYVIDIIRHDSKLASAGAYHGAEWCEGSLRTMRLLERCGLTFDVRGMNHMDAVDGPCVFIGNHMSTLETFVLPALIQPRKPVTFVVKDSLLAYPWFGPVLKSRNPIVVYRQNAREDLAAVLEGGAERLEQGTSIIVFPQSTRSATLDPSLFNSIGVKLARRAGRPLIPIALRSDAWRVGRHIKDFGGLDARLPVRFAFGEPMTVAGSGKGEHQAVCDFISGRLQAWEREGLALSAERPE